MNPPWPLWKKIVAYAALVALAAASVWIIDLKVASPSASPSSSTAKH